MRKFLALTLSVLLGVQPAVLAAPPARTVNDEMKDFIEKTGVGQGPQTLKELYDRVSPLLTAEQRYEMKRMITLHGDEKIPKFAVRKIKGVNGQQVYQLQGQDVGSAVTIELVGEKGNLLRINGKSFTENDLISTEHMMTKVGMPEETAKAFFPQAPTEVNPENLSAAQIAKLPVAEQRKYFQKLRQLLESMEAVQNVVPSRKVIKNEFTPENANKFSVVARWLQGEAAFAEMSVGEACVAGGHITVVVMDTQRVDPVTGQKRPGLTCGSDGRGGVRADLRGNCPQGQFSCNETLYGKAAGCSPAGERTTAQCNSQVIQNKTDIPNIADANNFNNLVDAAKQQAELLREECARITGGSPTPSQPQQQQGPRGRINQRRSTTDTNEPTADRAPAGNGKPSPTPVNPNALIEDQIRTCGELENRFAEINRWTCADPGFAASYPKICVPKPAGPPPQPPQPPAPPQTKFDKPKCRDLRPPQTSDANSKCGGENNKYGSLTPETGGEPGKPAPIDCIDDQGKPQAIFKCYCDPNVANFDVGKNICVSNGKGDDDDKKKKKKKDHDWKQYAFWGGLGIIGVGAITLAFRATKSALEKQYDYLNPQVQNPPLAPPTSNAPVSNTPSTGAGTNNKVAPAPRGSGTSK